MMSRPTLLPLVLSLLAASAGARAGTPTDPNGSAGPPAPAAPTPSVPTGQGAPAPAGTAAGIDPQASPLPGPDSDDPMLLGAQYTFILQHQSALRAPYSGPLSLEPGGDTQPTNTIGLYGGWAPAAWAQLYLDIEKFMGAGVSQATGLGAPTNGDVVREGAAGVRKVVYIARLYARFMLPLGDQVVQIDRSQDHIPGNEAANRLELKVGHMAVPDDFDENRYANSPRTQFLNWSLMNDTAWDYAADTRGYTDGVVVGYYSPAWSLKYGVYRMPEMANGEALVNSLFVASGQNLELTLSGLPTGTVLRLLGYLNTADMGTYDEALALAAADHGVPDIIATRQQGTRKYGFGVNVEQPLADNGDTGAFLRAGWNPGQHESFAFTEVDNQISGGVQVSGQEWNQPDGQVGVGLVSEGLSVPHREYLAAGGCGFMLCDGALSYGREQIVEAYYRLQRIWPEDPGPVRWDLGPDFQFIRNPGFNRARGPVSFWGVRLHVEY